MKTRSGSLIAAILIAVQCGIGGDSVVERTDLEADVERTIQVKMLSCGFNYQPDELALTLSIAFSAGFESVSLGGREFVSRVDRDFCINSLLSAPCEPTALDNLLALNLIEIAYCNPQPASAWDSDHLVQGALLK